MKIKYQDSKDDVFTYRIINFISGFSAALFNIFVLCIKKVHHIINFGKKFTIILYFSSIIYNRSWNKDHNCINAEY